MSQNVAMQTIFNGMNGMPPPAAAAPAPAAAAPAATAVEGEVVTVTPAASPLPSAISPMNPMMMGGDDMGFDVEAEDMAMAHMAGMSMGGGAAGMPNMAQMAMMGGDMEMEDYGLAVMSMMNQAAAAAPAADATPAMFLRRPRHTRHIAGMTPTTMLAGMPFRLEDS